MADEQLGWVFDSLVEFLRGPIWNIPILTFIEQKSVVFEPGAGDDEEFRKIHNAYKNLVDFMLGSYMEDLKITPDEFEKACSVASKKALNQFHQSLFQQVWAADDFEIFQRMMTQKNLELQLQALEFMSQKYGLLPDCMEAMSDDDSLRKEEAQVMQEVIKRVLEEHEIETSNSESKYSSTSAEEAEADLLEKSRLEAERQAENELLQQAMQLSMSATNSFPPESANLVPTNTPLEETTPHLKDETPQEEHSNQDNAKEEENSNETKDDEEKPCIHPEEKPTPAVETSNNLDCCEKTPSILPLIQPAEPLISSQSETPPSQLEVASAPSEMTSSQAKPTSSPDSNQTLSPSQLTSKEDRPWSEGDTSVYVTAQVEVTPMEMERRQLYLRQQRDRLLAMKKQERTKNLADHEGSKERPRSARAARKILREESTEVDPQTLAFRKSLAARLRTEVIDKAN